MLSRSAQQVMHELHFLDNRRSEYFRHEVDQAHRPVHFIQDDTQPNARRDRFGKLSRRTESGETARRGVWPTVS